MVRNILIVPRNAAIELIKDPQVPKMAMISITSFRKEIFVKGKAKDHLRKFGCKNILTIVFGDWTKKHYVKKPVPGVSSLFSRKQAKRIIVFLDYIKDEDIDLLLINCDAGVSRSGAVGVFAHRYLGTNDEYFKKYNKNILPNNHVYDLLAEESGLTGDYEAFWLNVPTDPKIEAMFI